MTEQAGSGAPARGSRPAAWEREAFVVRCLTTNRRLRRARRQVLHHGEMNMAPDNSIDNSVHIVLVGATHPGNIGAAARAMKTMGQQRLRLVQPRHFPSAEAAARAAGADDVLTRARVYASLEEAVADCSVVVAVSARRRNLSLPVYSPRQFASRCGAGRTAILFGRESSGLSNAEMQHCNCSVRIPSNPQYRSLNLAAAVQLVCYELWLLQADQGPERPPDKAAPLASQADMERFYQHLLEVMIDSGFHDPGRPRRLMARMRRLFNRAQLDSNELNILRGLLAALQKRSKRPPA